MLKLPLSEFIKRNKHIICFGLIVFLYIFTASWILINKIYLSIYMSFLYLVIFLIFITFLYFKENKRYREEIIWIKKGNFQRELPNSEHRLVSEIRKLDRINKDFKNKVYEKDKKVKEYLTIWTHQIKTPIFALKLLLKEEDVDRRKCNKKIFEIEEYISNILGYARIKSNSTDYVFDISSLDEIIRNVIRKYSIEFIGKNNTVNFNETNLKILTDSKWFSFLLEQIISNSCKYTENGEISVYLKENELVIKDTGIGIIEEDLPRIFDQGYTGYNGRLMKKSTGLGLNLALEIARELRLNLRCESEVKNFTKIYIDLKNVIELIRFTQRI